MLPQKDFKIERYVGPWLSCVHAGTLACTFMEKHIRIQARGLRMAGPKWLWTPRMLCNIPLISILKGRIPHQGWRTNKSIMLGTRTSAGHEHGTPKAHHQNRLSRDPLRVSLPPPQRHVNKLEATQPTQPGHLVVGMSQDLSNGHATLSKQPPPFSPREGLCLF